VPPEQQFVSGERMTGILVYVIGPSGSGKDSLIAYARRGMNALYALTWNASVQAQRGLRPVFFARRYITRPVSTGGERHYPLRPEEFQLRENRGEFPLSWHSHGLCYGIGNEINTHLAQGAVVVVNGSRQYLPEAIKRYPKLLPVLISASPDVLRERLEKRGREASAAIRERLQGAVMDVPDRTGLIRLDNSGALPEAGEIFTDLLARLRRIRRFEAEDSVFTEISHDEHKNITFPQYKCAGKRVSRLRPQNGSGFPKLIHPNGKRLVVFS